MSFRAALMILAFGTGCVAATDEVLTTAVTQEAIGDDEWGCPKWGCGTNSPVIDAVSFHELHELGIPNAEGYYIESFKPDDLSPSYRLDVRGGQIFARGSDGSYIGGKGVANWRILIKQVGTGAYYKVRIAEVESSKATPFWVNPNNRAVFPWTYKLEWQTGVMTWFEPVCGNPNGFDTDGLASFHAVVFEGDRIDPAGKKVYGEDVEWFNIGCGGHALAKQHLTAHTRVGSALMQITTTHADRTANLKMLVGDYCGTGQPFTVAGEPLAWKYANGWFSNVPWFHDGVEAVWTDTGAACLNTPRIDHNQTALGTQTFPNGIEDAIARTCKRPPTCGRGGSVGWVTSYLK